MSKYTREIQQKAKERAQKVVARAAKDGKIQGREFEKLQREGLYGGPVNGPRSSYVANAIARELAQNPELRIGKKASEVTGVKLSKSGRLTHDPSDDRPSFNLFGMGDDPGSAKWVQNSKGTYTYLGDIPSRVKKEDQPEGGGSQSTDPTSNTVEPSQDLLNAAAAANGGGSAVGGGNGSIHFNPGDDMIAATADYGNRATDDYFNRFIPDLKNQSILQALEMGESMGFHIGRLTAKPPELGDPKDLYKWYSKRIK